MAAMRITVGSDFTIGVNALIKATPLLLKPGIRLFVIVPLMVNTLLFIGLLWLAGYYYADLVQWIDHFLPAWLQWLNWLLWILFVISTYLLFVYCFSLLANIIAAPFNGLLAEKVQQYLTHSSLPPLPWHQQITELLKSSIRALRAAGYYLPRAIGLLILFLIPGINLIAGVCWLLFNAWMMSIQYMDYPAENNHINFPSLLQQLRQRRILSYSYGITVLLGTMIPIINFFIMPLGVVSATQLWVTELKSEPKKSATVHD